jgi:hypothetical protein
MGPIILNHRSIYAVLSWPIHLNMVEQSINPFPPPPPHSLCMVMQALNKIGRLCVHSHKLLVGDLGLVYTMDHEVGPWTMAFFHGPIS